MLTSGNEISQCESNPIPVCKYLSISVFLANLTPPNKQSFKIKSVFKSHDHVPN